MKAGFGWIWMDLAVSLCFTGPSLGSELSERLNASKTCM